MKVIIEILDNSMSQSGITSNLESAYRLIYFNMKIIELPSIDYIRKQRGTLHILIGIYAICTLAKNSE